MRLHHAGFIVNNLEAFEKNLLFEEKQIQVFDPVQQANLALYKNYSDSYIELIQPLNEKSFTWNALQKSGNHFHHFCYEVGTPEELHSIVSDLKLIEILKPVPALLFDNKMVTFYYSRNKQIVEFLINQ